MRLGLTIVALLAVGCGDFSESDLGGATDDFIDMDEPGGNCSAGPEQNPCIDPGSSGSPEGGPCQTTSQCVAGTVCVAPFMEGEVGDFTCSDQCIPLMDETMWCLDSTACCDPTAVCNARGLCVEGGVDESGTGSDTGTGTAGDGTAGDGTAGTGTDGTDTSGGTTAGSGSEGSGSDTGGSTGAMGGR